MNLGNILAFSTGTCAGWYSPALPVINTVPSSLLDGPISKEVAGWLGSGFPLGGLIGCIGFGLLANWIGYKRTMQWAVLPILVIKA